MAASLLGRLGAKPPSSPTVVDMPSLCEHLLQRVEDLGAAAQRVAEGRQPRRDDHELLHVERVVGVRAAVDHVHHRHRHPARAAAPEVAVERQPAFLGRRLGARHRHREDGVGAQARLVLGAVQLDQHAVEVRLLGDVEPDDGLADLGVHVLDRLLHALAEVALRIVVAKLDRLARAGGGARGHGRAPHHARLQQHVGFDGGIAARIEDLAGDDFDDGGHSGSPSRWRRARGGAFSGRYSSPTGGCPPSPPRRSQSFFRITSATFLEASASRSTGLAPPTATTTQVRPFRNCSVAQLGAPEGRGAADAASAWTGT